MTFVLEGSGPASQFVHLAFLGHTDATAHPTK